MIAQGLRGLETNGADGGTYVPEGDLSAHLQRLLAVQDLDTRLDRVRRDIAAIDAGEPWRDAARRLETLTRTLAGRVRERTSQEQQRRAAERERKAREEEALKLRGRLEGGRLRSAREFESVERELESLRERAGELETAELEAMERIEALDASLAELREAEAAAREVVESLREKASRERLRLADEAERLAERRGAAAAAVSGDVLSAYEEARRAGRGQGIGVLEGSRCRACGMELPPVWAQRVRRGRLERCENCGRVLVPAEPRSTP